MKYLLSFSFILFSFSFSVSADKKMPVTDAFGLVLGQKLEQRFVKECEVKEGVDVCSVNPDNKLDYFTDYTVTLEPYNFRVVYIDARGYYNKNCSTMKEELGKALTEHLVNFQEQEFMWGEGSKIAILECTKLEANYELSLKFIDMELQQKFIGS